MRHRLSRLPRVSDRVPSPPPSLVLDMQPRVTAVLVVLNGAQYLPRTLAALAAQSRRPDSVIAVDAGSSERTAATGLTEALSHYGLDAKAVSTPGKRSFGAAVAHAVQGLPPASSDDEWLWLLGHDNAPDAGALASLLATVEVAPSVAVAGPKLMRPDEPGVIASFGESITRFGRSVSLVSGELDQAQRDAQSDLLGVAQGGMLVRRRVWAALEGFDPALPSVDAALDFAIRARLADHRVVGVPSARVTTAGPPELFGKRSVSAGTQNRARRAAQLHRRLVYAPAAAVPLHWLTLLPLAILRSLVHLAAKRPGSIGGEFAAALGAAFDGGIPSARTRIRRNRALGWGAIGALRVPWAEVRERRASDRAAAAASRAVVRERPGFFMGGGAWVVLLAAVAGIIAFGRFVDAPAIAGGGLVPLSTTVGELWSHVGYGWHDLGAGFVGAADPFATLLAILGSLTFWSPSLSIVLLWLVAVPLAALTAWWCAARFSSRSWGPGIAALAWALAPPFLASLGGGHVGAVIAHILLPTLVLTVVEAARSWSMSAIASLLFAAVAASAPVLVPALVLGLIAWAAARPRGLLRILGVVIPAAALFAPLVIAQIARGTPLALFADPGAPVANGQTDGWQLAEGSPDGSTLGWGGFLETLGAPPSFGPVAVVVLLAPFAILALLALFLPGSRRAVPAMVIALVGFVTAVASTHLSVTLIGSSAVPIWPGSGLSLYWLGLIGATTVTLEILGMRAALPALVAALGLIAVAAPALVQSSSGQVAVAESNGRLLPAFASAEAASRPGLGTLVLAAQPDGGLAATVQRGLGTTLDEQSTLASTSIDVSEGDAAIAVLAGNLGSRSGFDVESELDSEQIAFVLLPAARGADASFTRQRVLEALDGNRLLTPIGDTPNGFLWNYAGIEDAAAPTGPGPLDTQTGVIVIVGQAIVFGLVLLLAIPTSRRRRVRAAGVPVPRRGGPSAPVGHPEPDQVGDSAASDRQDIVEPVPVTGRPERDRA